MALRIGGDRPEPGSPVARVAAALVDLVARSGEDIEAIIASPDRLRTLATEVLADTGEDVGQVLIDLAEKLVIDLRAPTVEIDLREAAAGDRRPMAPAPPRRRPDQRFGDV